MEKEVDTITLKEKVVKSVFWVYLSTLLSKGLGVITTFILAKLLFPEDFGLFAIATGVIGFLQAAAILGIDSAIIQRYKIEKEAVSTSFFCLFACGLFMTLVTFLLSPLIASFFEAEKLSRIMQWMSPLIFLTAIGMVPSSLLEKKFSFKKLFFIEIIPQFFYAGIAMVLAYLGFGVLSIVYGRLLARTFETMMLFIIEPIELIWSVNKQICKEMLWYGKELLFLGYLSYIILNFDNLFVGKFLGTIELGFYAFAYNIASIPVTHITSIIQRVTFPFYTEVQKSKEILQKGFMIEHRFTLFFCLPLAAGIIFFGKYILFGFYGEKWLPIVVPLQILGITAVMRGLGANGSNLLCAIGMPKFARNVTVAMVLVMAILIYPLTLWKGIAGTAFCILIIALISASIVFYRALKEIDFSLSTIWSASKIFIWNTAGTMLLLALLRFFIFKVPNVINVVGLLASAVVLYLLATYLFNKSILYEMKSLRKIL